MGDVRCVAVKLMYSFESFVLEKKVIDLLMKIQSGIIERGEHSDAVRITTHGIEINIDFIDETISVTYQPHNVDRKYLRDLIDALGRPSKITYILERVL